MPARRKAPHIARRGAAALAMLVLTGGGWGSLGAWADEHGYVPVAAPVLLIDTTGAAAEAPLLDEALARLRPGSRTALRVVGETVPYGAHWVHLRVQFAERSAAPSLLRLGPTGTEQPLAAMLRCREGASWPDQAVVALSEDGGLFLVNEALVPAFLRIEVLGWWDQSPDPAAPDPAAPDVPDGADCLSAEVLTPQPQPTPLPVTAPSSDAVPPSPTATPEASPAPTVTGGGGSGGRLASLDEFAPSGATFEGVLAPEVAPSGVPSIVERTVPVGHAAAPRLSLRPMVLPPHAGPPAAAPPNNPPISRDRTVTVQSIAEHALAVVVLLVAAWVINGRPVRRRRLHARLRRSSSSLPLQEQDRRRTLAELR